MRWGPGWRTASDSRLIARVLPIIPYLDPFTANWLDLDPQGLNDRVEIISSSTTVVPDSGAAVKVKFATRTGYPWFARITLPNGEAPPLGAEVFDDSERAVGAVGQGGLLYARVPQTRGSVSLVWGRAPGNAAGWSMPSTAMRRSRIAVACRIRSAGRD